MTRKQRRDATQAQIQASRQATQQTNVSQNRTTHGLNYNAATFQVLPCENQYDYNNLLKDLQEEHQPETPTEHLLVLSMPQHRWLLDRASPKLALNRKNEKSNSTNSTWPPKPCNTPTSNAAFTPIQPTAYPPKPRNSWRKPPNKPPKSPSTTP
jgi:hypothetical protein